MVQTAPTVAPSSVASSLGVAETCGNCKWGRKTDQMLGPDAPIECNGVPPTPYPVGQGAGGVQFMLMRPVQAAKTPRCALWAPMRSLLS